MKLKMYDNGALVDENGVLVARFVYADDEMKEHLRMATESFLIEREKRRAIEQERRSKMGKLVDGLGCSSETRNLMKMVLNTLPKGGYY